MEGATENYLATGNSVCCTPSNDKRLDEAYEAMSEQIDKIVAEIDKIVESYALVYAVDKDALFEAVVKDKLYITFTKKGEHQAQGLLSLASDDDKMMGESA